MAMATMQRHDTLAYIENTIAGKLDKQQQSMATNQTPVTGNLAQRRQAKLQYFGTKATKQAPVFFGTKATN
jgi:hypothetical protein